MRKIFYFFLSLLALTSLMFTGCSSTPPASTTTPPQTATAPKPEFEITSLDIVPPELFAGETAEITAIVKNTGDGTGTDVLKLLVDGRTAEIIETESISPGSSTAIRFTLQKNIPGTYKIEIGEMASNLVFKEVPAVSTTMISITPAVTTTSITPTTTKTATGNEIELKYDDGQMTNSIALGSGSCVAVRFTPPSTPFTINQIKIMVMLSPQGKIEDTEATVSIWDEDLNVIWTEPLKEAKYDLIGNWLYLYPDTQVNGDFRVVFFMNAIQGNSFIGCCWEKMDKNYASELVSPTVALTDWMHGLESSVPSATSNWIIRVVGQ